MTNCKMGVDPERLTQNPKPIEAIRKNPVSQFGIVFVFKSLSETGIPKIIRIAKTAKVSLITKD